MLNSVQHLYLVISRILRSRNKFGMTGGEYFCNPKGVGFFCNVFFFFEKCDYFFIIFFFTKNIQIFCKSINSRIDSIEQPKHIPHILTKEKMKAFSSLATRDQSGTYSASYSKFDHEYHYIRSLFYTVLLSFLVVMIIATIRY